MIRTLFDWTALGSLVPPPSPPHADFETAAKGGIHHLLAADISRSIARGAGRGAVVASSWHAVCILLPLLWLWE